ncbi:S8 family serine peptidase [Methanospirillum hungatei]|uniref:S8 family peptidase n=1 Tax=Methanospirillum hungatei TaxID=2203 RepID=UPI0026F184E4|nr:S8 family serine peptidase [Methanospirillum hungatei]MCA1915837.1 S8 family serine peptidase [Methanospirillum hungatei]
MSDSSASDVLSSDLLQILYKASCPPGQSPDDIIDSMEKNGQIRRNETGEWSVHILLELEKNQTSEKILPLLSHPAEDTSYHLVTGWATSENLTLLSGMSGIKRIMPVIPPASSGSFEMIQDEPSPVLVPENSWKKKLSTDLLQLLDDTYLSPGQSRADMMALMEKTGEVRIRDADIEVRISAKTTPSFSPSSFLDYFSSPVVDSVYGRIGGWIRTDNITRLAMQEGILSLVVQIPPRTSKITTEGDYLLQTREFRNISGLSGEGVKVGVISDGVDGLKELKALGELPDVEVLSDTVGGDEGLAMLQIIHDIAPNATLLFHDRGSSQIEFVRALDQLIIHGCNIICDDITYVEPFFEDGYISQNIIDRVLSYNVLYITAAGNFAKEHYQAPFHGYEDQGYLWQDFQGSSGKDMKFTVPSGLAGHVILQWDDRFGASANNYDLFLYDDSGREIARSVNLQDGDDDPMEWVRFVNSADRPREFTVKVVQAAAEDALLEIYVLPLSGRSVELDPYTPEDSVFGQQAVKQALVVGAVAPGGKNLTVQEYSSRGPALIRYPVYELRNKPDLVAPDHITVLTGSMQHAVFTGTSAAAPHIAGLAALVMSGSLGMKESEVRKIILNATGTSPDAWDPVYGRGIPLATNLSLPENTSGNIWYPVMNGCNFEPRMYDAAEKVLLYPGWNMVSIPYPLARGNETAQIFNPVHTACHSIWRYNPAGGFWSVVRPNDTLFQMDVVWVYSEQETGINLHFDTTGTNQTVKQLYQGWNPVGVPGRESITARDLLSPLTDAWTTVLVFDPRTQEFRPSIINGGLGTYSPSRLLYPSEGWWIYMNRPGILFPGC